MAEYQVTYYDAGFIKNLKENLPLKASLPHKNPILVVKPPEKTEEVMFRIGKVEVPQAFIMQLGVLSNCNVSVMRVASGYLGEFVLQCTRCSERTKLTDSLLLVKERDLAASIEEFCVSHRHDPKALSKEGRHFREE